MKLQTIINIVNDKYRGHSLYLISILISIYSLFSNINLININ